MKKIAYVTERKTGLSNGSSVRDARLLESLRINAEVDVIFNDVSTYGRLDSILFSNKSLPDDVKNVLLSPSYDYVIVSTFTVSPFFHSYAHINPNAIYYLCDSAFHMRSQFLNLKFKLLTFFLSWKESRILNKTKIAYLGGDEISKIPRKYQDNAIVFPFHIDLNDNVFDESGFISFIGDYSFTPNKVALNKILELAKNSSLNFKLFGSNFDLETLLPANVEYCGYVEDVSDAYRGARALIYPIRYGTGVKNKVIEAMSFGIPVIGYKEAFTNIEFEDAIILSEYNSFSDRLFFNLLSYSKKSRLFIKEKMNKGRVSTFIMEQLSRVK